MTAVQDLYKNYINGQWVDPVTAKSLDVINPATEEVCAHISMGSEEDVNKAVAAAKAAVESFSRTSRQERIELLESCVEVYKKYYMDMFINGFGGMSAAQKHLGGPPIFPTRDNQNSDVKYEVAKGLASKTDDKLYIPKTDQKPLEVIGEDGFELI